MRRGAPIAVALGLVVSAVWAQGALARSVGHARRSVLGVPVHVITVNMADPKVRVSVATARGFPGGAEPIDHILARSMPSAAVTGTYFSKRTHLPVGDIVVGGVPRYFGGMGTALAITPYNAVELRAVPYGRHQDWRRFETVLSAGPRLLRKGQVSVSPRREGFSDPRVLGRAPRTAAGITARGKLLLVATRRSVTLTELAKVLARLGAVEAMALDGGGSTAMYFDGRHMVRPQRALVNLLVVHENVPLLARAVTPMSPEEQAGHRAWRLAKAQEHYGAGQRLRRGGDAEGAMAQFSAAIALAPENASYCVALADTLETEGHAATAAQVLTRAGGLLVAKAEYDSAVGKLTRAVSLDRGNRAARVQLGIAFLHVKRVAAEEQAQGGKLGRRAPAAPELHPQPLISAAHPGQLTVVALRLPAQLRWLPSSRAEPGGPSRTEPSLRDFLGGAYVFENPSILVVVSLIVHSLDYVHAADVELVRPHRWGPHRLAGSVSTPTS
ncbi:MAG: phosphodiester glycosidase family protein [Armatimonadota bacterium]